MNDPARHNRRQKSKQVTRRTREPEPDSSSSEEAAMTPTPEPTTSRPTDEPTTAIPTTLAPTDPPTYPPPTPPPTKGSDYRPHCKICITNTWDMSKLRTSGFDFDPSGEYRLVMTDEDEYSSWPSYLPAPHDPFYPCPYQVTLSGPDGEYHEAPPWGPEEYRYPLPIYHQSADQNADGSEYWIFFYYIGWYRNSLTSYRIYAKHPNDGNPHLVFINYNYARMEGYFWFYD